MNETTQQQQQSRESNENFCREEEEKEKKRKKERERERERENETERIVAEIVYVVLRNGDDGQTDGSSWRSFDVYVT